MKKTIFVFCWILLLVTNFKLVLAQNDAHELQDKALAAEIERLAVFFDFDEQARTELHKLCLVQLQVEVAELKLLDQESKSDESQSILNFRNRTLSSKFLELIRDQAKDRLPDDAKSEMSRYIDQQQQLAMIGKLLMQQSFVSTVDNCLCLSQQQEQNLLAFIQGCWEEHWESGGIALSEVAKHEQPSQFFVIDGESLLTEEQATFLNRHSIPLTLRQYDKLMRSSRRGVEWDAAEFLSISKQLLRLKRGELGTSELDEKQLQILSVGEKIAASKVTKAWQKVFDELLEKRHSDGTLQLINLPILTQCLRDSEWKAAVRKAFGESIVETIEKDRHKKLDLSKRLTQFNFLTVHLSKQAGVSLTFDQYRQFIEAIEENVDPPTDNDTYSRYWLDILKLPEEDFRRILKPFQWEKAKAWIEKYRD